MKQFSFLLILLLCLSLVAIPAAGVEDASIRSFYYGVDPQAGLVGQVPAGISDEVLLSRLFAAGELSLPEGVKTGAPIHVGEEAAMTLVVQADCNCDGGFSVSDMLMVKSLLLGLTEFSPAQAQAGDITGDGAVTISDFLQMKQQILGMVEFTPQAVDGAAGTTGMLLSMGDTALWGDSEADVTVQGDAVTWNGGTITAEAPGTALLSQGSEALLVTVCSDPLQVSLPDSEIALRAGETFQLSASINHPVTSEITYSVSDEALATVSETGLVTALDKGTVTVTATLPNGLSDSQTVNIRNRYTVCLDAGHQKEGIYTKVPVGPGSKEMKTALSGGTQGKVTGIPEHELNLAVALMLKEELIKRGYDVVMIRETDTCPMTNPERAIYAS